MKREKLTACNAPSFWIEERCRQVKLLYKRMPAWRLCRKLGCTENALYHQAHRMGITKIALKNDKNKI